MNSEDIPSTPSTPVTPGTPGGPLFAGLKPDRNGNGKKSSSSLLKSCKCFSVEEAWALEEGTLPPVSCSLPPPPVSLSRKVGAEFIGTLILIFSGTATAIVNQKTGGAETLIGLAGSTGLAVMIVILATGHISGAHLNPAVTIAFAALKHFPWKHVTNQFNIDWLKITPFIKATFFFYSDSYLCFYFSIFCIQIPAYIAAQILASISAAFLLKAIFHPIMGGGVTVPSGAYGQAFALEFMISFNLMFVVTAVATDTRAVSNTTYLV
ncbi:OLC1v1014594C1 [Oldenlandia corymbosa var. corymbosa]|uniref:OLC1v1014594C1 n=1 Tax=Oldenlandia corymbosa var. corymbosa TaxID=529605 RepID=A0AAV1E4I4_OLDCO|nr:OLC1v1014594C1 [Oldenlandia corymbosa var. corymbosa]